MGFRGDGIVKRTSTDRARMDTAFQGERMNVEKRDLTPEQLHRLTTLIRDWIADPNSESTAEEVGVPKRDRTGFEEKSCDER